MPKPLEGIKVLDFTRVLAGPYCTMMLADMGAEIIKIEFPIVGDDSRHFGPPFINGEAIYFLSINRGKKSVVLNLKTKGGVKIIRDIIKDMDVLVENFRPGTLEKLGLGYDELKKINPRLIYAASSGFGSTGPDKDKPGYDLILQAKGGIMSITSHKKNGPFTRVGVSEADIVAGMTTAFAISTALYRREKTGAGDRIDISMLDCQIAFMTPAVPAYLNLGIIAKPAGNTHPLIKPFSAYKTGDKEIVIAAGNNKLYCQLCEVLGLPELKTDERFVNNSSRIANYDILHELLEKKTKGYSSVELLKLLDEAGVPASKINTVKEAVEEPQVKARNMLQKVHHKKTGDIWLFGIPVKMDSCDDNITAPPPRLGEHTGEVLKKYLNKTDKEINDLVAEKAIELEKD